MLLFIILLIVYKYPVFSCHLISDLFYFETERFKDEDITLPDVDLVVINGNIGSGKKSMQYAELLCSKYPEIAFVYNPGFTEAYIGNLLKSDDEFFNGINNRQLLNDNWPKNLYYSKDNMIITLRNGFTIDVLAMFGFPTIARYHGDWKDTYFYKNVIAEVTPDINHPLLKKPKDTSNVWHGNSWIWAYPEWINKKCQIETDKARKWELTPSHYKVLVTHINPVNDTRCKNIDYMPYQIHLYDMLWLTADNKVDNMLFQGAHLKSNPGRGSTPRSSVIEVKWVLTK